MEDDQNSEEPEVTPQDQESNAVETDQKPVEEKPSDGSHEPDDSQNRNWKEIRRKQREAEIREKTKDELIDRLLKERNVQPTAPPAPQPDEFSEMSSEDYPTLGQTDKRIDKRSEKISRDTYAKMRQEEEASKWAQKLQSEYSDFPDVVNPDSIAVFEKNNRKLAETIAKLKDPYDMGYQTYHFIKSMGLGDKSAEKRHVKEVEKKLEKGENTVQSPQAYSKRPMAQAFRLTESEKSKLFEEMQEAAAKVGFGY